MAKRVTMAELEWRFEMDCRSDDLDAAAGKLVAELVKESGEWVVRLSGPVSTTLYPDRGTKAEAEKLLRHVRRNPREYVVEFMD